jgi:hypothetical protein
MLAVLLLGMTLTYGYNQWRNSPERKQRQYEAKQVQARKQWHEKGFGSCYAAGINFETLTEYEIELCRRAYNAGYDDGYNDGESSGYTRGWSAGRL